MFHGPCGLAHPLPWAPVSHKPHTPGTILSATIRLLAPRHIQTIPYTSQNLCTRLHADAWTQYPCHRPVLSRHVDTIHCMTPSLSPQPHAPTDLYHLYHLYHSQWQTRLQAVGRELPIRASSGRIVMQQTFYFLSRRFETCLADHGGAANDSPPTSIRTAYLKICCQPRYHSTEGCSDRSLPPHCLEPSEHKLLTPPPTPTPTPSKTGYPVLGDRDLKIKKSIGGWFYWAK